MGSLSSIQRTMINKASQDAPQRAKPVKPRSRLPGSNEALIGGAGVAGVGGLLAWGSHLRHGRWEHNLTEPPKIHRVMRFRGDAKRAMVAGTGLAAYGAYAQNRNKKNGYAP